MLNDIKIISLLADVQDWEHALLKRHNDANHPIHKLSFLADIGISPQEPGIQSAINKFLNTDLKKALFRSFQIIQPTLVGVA